MSIFASYEKRFAEWMMHHEFNRKIQTESPFSGYNPDDGIENVCSIQESPPHKILPVEELRKKRLERFSAPAVPGIDRPVSRAQKPKPNYQIVQSPQVVSVEKKASSEHVQYGNFWGRSHFVATQRRTGYFLVDDRFVISVPENLVDHAFEINSDTEITIIHKFDGANDPVSSEIANKVQNWFAWERSKLSNLFTFSLGAAVMLSLSVIALGEQNHLAGKLFSRALLIGSVAMQSMVLFVGYKFYHLYLLEERKGSIKDLGQWVWQIRKSAQYYPFSRVGAPVAKFFTPKELAGLDYLRINTLQFLRLGAETSFVQGVQSEKHPYSVSLNSAVPTLNDVETRAAIVDNCFRAQYKDEALQELAVKMWSHLSWSCKKIQVMSGISAIGLTLLSLQGFPVYTVVALYVGTVASTCLFGWSLHRTHFAEKQLDVWQRPGEDFAKRRKAALELPLQQIIQKKCLFHPGQPTGTLLGVEILSIFKRDFKRFAAPLLNKTCNTPEEKHRWVLAFFEGNPLQINFFEGNPQLANETGWKDVRKFQDQIDQLIKVKKHLEENYVNDFERRQAAVKQKYEAIQQAFVKKAETYSAANKIPFLIANNYFQRVMKVLLAECLDPIVAFNQKDLAKVNAFGSLIYPQVRALLEEANKGLVQDQAYGLEAIADPATFVPGNFQQELDAITANYPQNVIDKAKALAPEEAYQNFVTAVFA